MSLLNKLLPQCGHRRFGSIFFIFCMASALLLMLLYSKFIFSSKTDENIFLATALIGNTGNLGIPLGIALFGEQSVPYTSIINIANVFFMYTISVYFFADRKSVV